MIWRTISIVSRPVKLGQVHVHQGEMDILALDDVDRLLAALGQEGPIPHGLENLAEGLANRRVVVGDQDGIRAIQGHHDQSRTREGQGRRVYRMAL